MFTPPFLASQLAARLYDALLVYESILENQQGESNYLQSRMATLLREPTGELLNRLHAHHLIPEINIHDFSSEDITYIFNFLR